VHSTDELMRHAHKGKLWLTNNSMSAPTSSKLEIDWPSPL
jgi:hypothetical protein